MCVCVCVRNKLFSQRSPAIIIPSQGPLYDVVDISASLIVSGPLARPILGCGVRACAFAE